MKAMKSSPPDRQLSKTSNYLEVSAQQIFKREAGKGEMEGSYQAGCIRNKIDMVDLFPIKILFL